MLQDVPGSDSVAAVRRVRDPVGEHQKRRFGIAETACLLLVIHFLKVAS